MVVHVYNELMEGLKGPTDYVSVIPDKYTKVLSRKIIKQLRENWCAGKTHMPTTKLNKKVTLKALFTLDSSKQAEKIQKQRDTMEKLKNSITVDDKEYNVVKLDKSKMEDIIVKQTGSNDHVMASNNN